MANIDVEIESVINWK